MIALLLAGSISWIATWVSAPQLVEPNNLPPEPGFADATLRQVVHTTLGGKRVRLRLSNEFGDSPLDLSSVSIALSAGNGKSVTDTERPVAFQGNQPILIPPGAPALSDPLPFDLPEGGDLAITFQFHRVPKNLTGHPGSRTTSYINYRSIDDFSKAVKVTHWYFLSAVEVESPKGAAVSIIGDSLTDGRGSTTDGNTRWPDNLARRLKGRGIAVQNQGIGGNRLLGDGLGPSVLARLDRDVLVPSGVRWLIVFEGINDLGTCPVQELGLKAGQMIDAYQQIVTRAHARGIKVYGATITPCAGSGYGSPQLEEARQRINAWIRTKGNYDAVIDFDAAVKDPKEPSRLRADLDTGDHLHMNNAGYRLLADTVDLSLFKR